MNYRAIAEFLYCILDDIDSADDMCKSSDAFYRKTVRRLQEYKNEVGDSPDGQTIVFKEPLKEYGLTRLL